MKGRRKSYTKNGLGINNCWMKPRKKEKKKEKKKSWIKYWFREFKRKFKNNKVYNYNEKFKKEIIFSKLERKTN